MLHQSGSKSINERKRKTLWKNIATALAAGVVFCTIYSLIMPAVSQEAQTFCGYEEHSAHTKECYEKERVLICDLTEDGHVHSDACYEEREKLVCDRPVHEHVLQCFSDPEADLKTADVWEQGFADLEPGSNRPEDVIAVASTQIGYTESIKNYQVRDDGITMDGYTRYGEWFGTPYDEWSAIFCSFCLNYANVDNTVIPWNSDCEKWVEILSDPAYGLYREAAAYEPKPGDLVFFGLHTDPETNERKPDHAGLVAEVICDEGTGEFTGFRTIEGDRDDKVCKVYYAIGDESILGYGQFPEVPEEESGEALKEAIGEASEEASVEVLNEDSGEELEEASGGESGEAPKEAPAEASEEASGGGVSESVPFEFTADTKTGFGVRLTGLSDALPFPAEEITLTVCDVHGENAEEQLSQAAEADGIVIDQMYLFDITLWHDGEVIEPTGNVTVTFRDICDEDESASVYHVDPGQKETTYMDAVAEDGDVVIDTDHFSIYGIVLGKESGKHISGSAEIDWDSAADTIQSFEVKASSNELGDARYYVQYYDGADWISGVGPSGKTAVKTEVTLDAFSLLDDDAPADRQYRAYAYKDKNNHAESTAFTLSDLFDEIRPGFKDWLETDYKPGHSNTPPQTQAELIAAFALYESVPIARISSSVEDVHDAHRLVLNAAVDPEVANAVYQWEYCDKLTDTWMSLSAETGSRLDVTDLTALSDGADVRCSVYDDNAELQAVSNILNVNNSTEVQANTTSFTVSKKWIGPAAERPASITLRLFKNGVEETSVVLDGTNGWKYEFENLPYYDAEGYAYEYSVSEDTVSGFETTYSDLYVISDLNTGIHFVKSDVLQPGESYALVSSGVYISSKDGRLTGTSAERSDASVTYDGITYGGELLEDVTGSGSWNVTYNDDGTYTFFDGTNYLAMNKDGNPFLSSSLQNGESTTSFSVEGDGYISALVKNGANKRYINVKTKNGSFEKFEGKDKIGEASLFTFYQSVDVKGAYDRYEEKVTNKFIVPDADTAISSGKYIDYLGDDADNPDTDLTGEFYRQYLDAEVTGNTAMDFLFVVDNTSSMTEKMNDVRRDYIVNEVLNGGYTSGTDQGLLTQVLRANPNNKAAVVTFCGLGSGGMSYNQMLTDMPEVITQMDWFSLSDPTDVAPFADVRYTEGGGTCYEAGILRAEEMMQEPEIAGDGNVKVVIFLGDGEPNGVLLNASDEIASKTELADKDAVFFSWNRSTSIGVTGAKNAMDYFVEETQGLQGTGQDQVELYTISVGYDASGENDILGYMAETGGGDKYVVNTITQIQDAFREICSHYLMSEFAITDHLSQYAELYKDQLDLKVTRVDTNTDTETVIWEGGWNDSGSIGSAVNGGSKYVESVTFEESTSTDSTGTLTVKFQSYYILETGVKYVVSYNLKATDLAIDEYAANGYGSTKGDTGTDYPGNDTSTDESGFRSNRLNETRL